MKHEPLRALPIMVVAGLACLAAPVQSAERERALAFAELDRNHDGYISKTEARAEEGLVALLPELDINGDGKLSREEFQEEYDACSVAAPQASTAPART